MYSPIMVRPMREELTAIGFEELRTADDVDNFMAAKQGTALLVINSVCGCAAGQARPGVRFALEQAESRGLKPARLVTVFAGQDAEATQKARSYFADIPHSSPSMAVFRDGELVYFVPRHKIEGRSAEQVAQDLLGAFERNEG